MVGRAITLDEKPSVLRRQEVVMIHEYCPECGAVFAGDDDEDDSW